jgi:hypothetical protein
MLIVVLRVRRIIYGTRVSVSRAVGYSMYYVGLACFFVAFSYFEGISSWYFLFYALDFVLALIIAYKLASTRLYFWRKPDGSIYSKGGILIYAIYIIGLIARIAIGYIFIGPSAFTINLPLPATTLSQTAVTATVFTDLLLVFGAGMLFGRNMHLLKRFYAIKNGKESLPQEEEPFAGSNKDTSMPS